MKKLLLVGPAIIVLLAMVNPFEMWRSIVLGWLLFPYHTLPRMTLDWPSVCVGCLALVLFTAGVHAIGRTWRLSAAEDPRWKLRWSLSVVVGVFLLFAASISLVAIVHQTGWLLTSQEPYYVQTYSQRVRLYGGESSSNELKVIGCYLANCDDLYGSLPARAFTPDGRMLHSWETHLLPFLNYTTFGLGGDFDLKLPWNHPQNEKFFKSILPEFINTSLPSPPVLDEQGFGLSHYSANSWVIGANKSARLRDITDGTANTLLVGEVNANFKPWGHPVNWRDPAKGINRSPHGFGGSPYSGGANFSMADGSVRFVSEHIHPDVLRALSTPAGGEEMDASILGSSR